MMRKPFSPIAALVSFLLAGCFTDFDPRTVKCRLGVTADCPPDYVCTQLGEGTPMCRKRSAGDGSVAADDGAPASLDTGAEVASEAGRANDGAAGSDSGRIDSRYQGDGLLDVPFSPPVDAEVPDRPNPGSGGTGGAGTGGSTGMGDASNDVGSGGFAGSGGVGGAAGAPGTGGVTGAGGIRTGGATGTGGVAAGGGTVGTGGVIGSGGVGTGGASGTGGTVGTGGSATGGTTGTGGTPGTGGTSATGGTPGASTGCGKTSSIAFGAVPNEPPSGFGNGGYVTLQSGGQTRGFAMRLPDNYDKNHPYWLIFAFHWNGGTVANIDNGGTNGYQAAYFGLQAQSANGAIFVAPQGLSNGWANSGGQDLTFVDDMVKLIEDNYCVDTTRLYANGFSYGGGMTYAIACARAKVFRAVAIYEGAQLSGCTGGNDPIAYWQMAGLTDSTVSLGMATPLRDRFATNNGCTIGAEPPRPPAPPPYLDPGGHVCTDYAGCSSGHPLRWCVHQSGHGPAIVDGTSDLYNSCATPPKTCSDTCKCTWVPADVWGFFTSL